jgi:hypothetical protein
LGDFYKKISILEVEIGKNGPGILGVKILQAGLARYQSLHLPSLRN